MRLDPLHAIYGMPWRTPLLRAFAAGQSQSKTVRWAPLLSLAVPCFMPQTCPRAPLGYESFEHHSAGCSPVPNQPIYRGRGCLPTGSRPALFRAVSASLVSKP
jgi:hypothetical protein